MNVDSTGSSSLGLDKPVVAAVSSRGPDPELLKQLDSELLAISTAKLTEAQGRERFRRFTIAILKAIGCCHVRRDDDGDWDAKPSHSDGRVPRRHDFATELGKVCELTINSAKLQIHNLTIPETIGIFAPVDSSGMFDEILLLVLPADRDLSTALVIVERVIASFRLWLTGRRAELMDWKLSSLAMIMELSSKLETQDSYGEACDELVNQLKNALGCSTVAFGSPTDGNSIKDNSKPGRMKLRAVSGRQLVDHKSELGRCYSEVLEESKLREDPGIFPVITDENAHLLIAHQRLASVANNESVYSQPLVSDSGKFAGTIICTGTSKQFGDKRFSRFLASAAPRIATTLSILERAEKSRLSKLATKFLKLTSTRAKYLILAGLVGFVVAMLIPIEYRIRCNGSVEPVDRRFAVAPFSGLIVAGFVQQGDRVREGDLLAEMDGKSVRWELTGIAAQRNQSVRNREIELAQANVPQALLAELESRRLASREKTLRYQEEHLQIKSPIDGIVLGGSLENSEAASVETGQVMFEIGSVSPVRFRASIPASEIGHVDQNAEVKVWIEGHEAAPIVANLERIYPRSEMKDAKNVFIAELMIENPDEKFKPGMKGRVRIDCERKRLGWIIFHKPMNFFRANFAWW